MKMNTSHSRTYGMELKFIAVWREIYNCMPTLKEERDLKSVTHSSTLEPQGKNSKLNLKGAGWG